MKLLRTILLLSSTIHIIAANAQTLAVGNTPVNVNVGPMGNATATIPIFCPPGRAGVQPQVAIQYNSSLGEGILGKNTTLVGLSAITRIGKNYHIDGVQKGVDLDATDNFALDGNPLIWVSGSAYGTSGSVYRTENDQFAKITFTGTHFNAETKDGGLLIYGFGNTRLVPSGSTENLSYHLWRSYDVFGNYIEYEYVMPGGQIQLAEIKYTGFDSGRNGTRVGTGSAAPFNSIVFTYKASVASNKSWIKGASLQSEKILEKIQVYESSNIARTYDFTYTDDGITNYLTSIKESNGAGEYFEPVILEWVSDGNNIRVNGSHSAGSSRTGVKNADLTTTLTGDFNGDGKSDLLQIEGILMPSAGYTLNSSHKYKILSHNPLSDQVGVTVLSSGNLPSIMPQNICKVLVGDLNQDGLDDILFQTIDYLWHSGNTMDLFIHYHAMIAHVQGGISDVSVNFNVVPNYFVSYIYASYPKGNPHYKDQLFHTPYLGDCDGDGLLDLVEIQKTYIPSIEKFHMSDVMVTYGKARLDRYHLNLANANTGAPLYHEFLGDYNGNGRTDIMLGFNTYAHVIEPNGIGGGRDYLVASNGFPTQWHKNLTPGDFNGDGRTDFLCYTGGKWWVNYATGSNWDAKDATLLWGFDNISPDHSSNVPPIEVNEGNSPFIYNWKRAGFVMQVGDFNGDGRDDIIQRHVHFGFIDGHTANDQKMFYSTGYGFINVSLPPDPASFQRFDYNFSLIADFNGDGKADCFSREFASGYTVKYSFFTSIQYFKEFSNRCIGIKPSSKSEHTFTFKPLPQSLQFKRDFGVKYDQVTSIVPRLWIVEEHKYAVDNTGIDKRIRYHYNSFLFHRHGRGALGFWKTATVDFDNDPNKRTTIITNNDQCKERLHVFQPKVIESYKTSSTSNHNRFVTGSTLLAKQEFTYINKRTTANSPNAAGAANNRIYFTYQNKITETDYIKQVKKYTCQEFDENGNMYFSRVAHYQVNDFTKLESIVTTHNEFAKFASWLPSQTTKTKTTAIRYPNGVMQMEYENETHMDYYKPNNALMRVFKYMNTPKSTTTSYSYDRFGNLTHKNLDYAGNPHGLMQIEANTYDVSGRFLAAAKNVLNQVTTYTFEPMYGNMLSVVDVKGLTKSYAYDGWGRLIQTNTPDGQHVTISRHRNGSLPVWVTTNTPNYSIRTTTSTGEQTIEYFDNAGRKMAYRQNGLSAALSFKDWAYNNKGELVRESNVYFGPQTQLFTNYEYDDYSRLIKTTYNGTVMSTVNYDKTTTTVTTKIEGRNVVKKSTAYASGQLAKMADPGGTVNYMLGSHGLPIQITTNGTTTSIGYDIALNKTQLTDPNAGITQYEYNALGQLVKQTDAKNNIYQMVYDKLGRLISKTGGANEEYIYTYFSTLNQPNLNLLEKEELKVNSNLVHKKEYTYGNIGQLLTTKEEAPGIFTTKEVKYTYDARMRVLQTHYPNLKTENVFDNKNNLKQIKLIEKAGVPQNIILWENLKETAGGQTSEFQYGNGQKTTLSFDANQQLMSIAAKHPTLGGLQYNAMDLKYIFELTSGNLMDKRNDANIWPDRETFKYDNSDRLIAITQHGRPTKRASQLIADFMDDDPQYVYGMEYENNGNITGKYGAGSMTYTSSQPHAVTRNEIRDVQDPNNNIDLIPRIVPYNHLSNQSITYTPFNRPKRIVQTNPINPNPSLHAIIEIGFEYGIDQQRIEMKIKETHTLTNTTHYINSCNMEVVNGDEVTYIYAEGMPIAMHRSSDNKIYYFHTDYQQSLLAITNENGEVVERRSYDAWGRPRRTDNLEYNLPNPFGGSNSIFTMRGYTFHEHLEMVGLINMNARMYDPILGRVLSPDNLVSDASSTQGFNRYSYCFNNPTKYIDPDGNEPITIAILIGVAVGAYMGGRMANDNNSDPTMWNYQSGKTWGYMLGGAIVGGASAGLAAKIAVSGAAGAKTMSIIMGSYTNSLGTQVYTGGQTDVCVSFGFGSVNLSEGTSNGIWNWGENSTMENIGYSLGAFANFTDVMGAINTPDANYQLRTDNTEVGKLDPGHSSIRKDSESIISFGPKGSNRVKSFLGTKSTNKYHDDILERPDLNIKLNSKAVSGLSKQLPKIPYSAGTGIQCAGATSMAGLLSGKFMLNMGLLMLNTPQLTYYSYKYEQFIMMSSILTTVHTTK